MRRTFSLLYESPIQGRAWPRTPENFCPQFFERLEWLREESQRRYHNEWGHVIPRPWRMFRWFLGPGRPRDYHVLPWKFGEIITVIVVDQTHAGEVLRWGVKFQDLELATLFKLTFGNDGTV